MKQFKGCDFFITMAFILCLLKALNTNDWPSSFLFAIAMSGFILWDVRERITAFKISEGKIEAELQLVQHTRKEIQDIYKKILILHITLMENSSRWAGWAPVRYKREIERVKQLCKEQSIEDPEIFAATEFWRKIDALTPIEQVLSKQLVNIDQIRDLKSLWDDIVNEEAPMDRLIDFINRTEIPQETKIKLIAEIKKNLN